MHLKRPPRLPADHLAPLDTLMTSYMHWRQESQSVEESYRAWHCAAGGDRDGAFDDYLAALDREERAATGYQTLVERVRQP